LLNISKLESLIKSKGWSKTFFAMQFDKNKGWITDMKRGVGLPDENMLADIAERLDTTIDYLTDKTEQKNKPAAQSDGRDEKTQEIVEIINNLPPDLREIAESTLRSLSDAAKKRNSK